jgi:hypothetical protein
VTTDEKRKLITQIGAANEVVYRIICPPGTFALALTTAIIAPLGSLFLIWALYLR